MMHQLSPLIVVYADQAGEVPAEQLAFALGEDRAEPVAGIAAAVHMLAARPTPPSYLVIDIGHRGVDILPELEALAEHCDASVRVVVCGAVNDIHFYRELRKRGVLEYFPYPLRISDMRDALRNQALVKASGVRQEKREGTVITFMSAASGDGASTVALNVAYYLASALKKSTVIVDMDYQFGMVARHLDIDAQFGMRELLEYPDRGVDGTLVNKMLCSYGEDLKVIAAPNELRRMPPVSPPVIRDMVTVLKSQFDYVVIDLPHVWSDWTAAVLAQANHHVIVAQLWLRSLTHLTRLATAWREIGVEKESITLVVNRSGAKFKEAITVKDAERVTGRPVDHFLANDIKTITQAENQGKTVMEIASSQMEKQFRDLARDLVVRTGGSVPPLPEEKTKSVSLFKKKG